MKLKNVQISSEKNVFYITDIILRENVSNVIVGRRCRFKKFSCILMIERLR